nr:MAG TPA: hypothetical protein [Caudoviricetes sp.]
MSSAFRSAGLSLICHGKAVFLCEYNITFSVLVMQPA